MTVYKTIPELAPSDAAIGADQVEIWRSGTSRSLTVGQLVSLATYGGPINVKQYGAVGDGVTNDNAAFAAAIAAGSPIYVPPGTYNLGSTALRPKTGTKIYGVPGLSILKRTGNDASSYLQAYFDIIDVQDVTLDGLVFDFTANTSREYGFIVRSTTLGLTQRIAIRNCTFKNTPNFIERFVQGVRIEDNYFLGGGINGASSGVGIGGQIVAGAGVNSDGVSRDITIANNYFENMRTEAVDVNWNVWDVVICNNMMINCDLTTGTGEYIDIGGSTDGTNICRHIIVSGNNIIVTNAALASTGIRIKQWTTDVTVTGNTIRSASGGSASAAITTNVSASDVTITGNAIEGFQAGIAATSPGSRVTITGNSIRGSLSGITATGCTDLNISGNTIAVATPTGTARGIFLTSCTGFVIADNRVFGFGIDGISTDAGSSPGTISGNFSSGNVTDGIHVFGPNIAITGNTAYLNGRIGINLAGAQHLTLVGNSSYNNSQITANQYGINVAAGCDFAMVEGNKSYDTQGVGATQNGIAFGACDRVKYNNNICWPVKTTAQAGTGSLTNSSVGTAGNIVA
jgi:Pectate lyase superfamily protein/Right handed beta helix region